MVKEIWKVNVAVEVIRDSKGRFIHWHKLKLEDLKLGLVPEPQILEIEKEPIYRASWGLSGVPVHGLYYGFLLQAFAFEGALKTNMGKLERIFTREVSAVLRSSSYASEQRPLMGVEQPTESMADPAFNRTWEFRVEKDGRIENMKEGNF